jgi:hypothetical protein
LATDEVAEAFNSRGIKVVEGDWTTEDPIITEWLEMYDRIGVPLYLYFPKGSTLETVTILPQILLPELVVNIIDEADANAEVMYASEDAEEAIEEEPYVLPDSEPDWSIVQAYIDLDTAWHALSSEISKSEASDEEKARRRDEERGAHPEIEPAHAAATAIAKLDGDHEKTLEAAEFLIEHTRGSKIQNESVFLGVTTLNKHVPDYDDWPSVLRYVDFYTDPNDSMEIESFFENFADVNPILSQLRPPDTILHPARCGSRTPFRHRWMSARAIARGPSSLQPA